MISVREIIYRAVISLACIRFLRNAKQRARSPSLPNTAYRWDGIHYYKKGAALYFQTMVPQLLQPAPPTPTATTPTPTTPAAQP